jgi:cell division protein FtsB
MKYLASVLLVLLVLLQYRLWFGDAGVREVNRLHAEITHQKSENELLRERNRTLSAEVQDLKKGTTAIEERARTDLGMVGQRETFYQVVTPRTSAKTTDEDPEARVAQSGSQVDHRAGKKPEAE